MMKTNHFLFSVLFLLTFFAIKANAQTGCPVTISQPAELKIENITKASYHGSDLSCSTSTDGKITVTASGGTTPYQYSIDNGANFQAGNVFSGLAAGTYQIVVRDANGCTTVAQAISITAPQPLTMTIQKSDVTCFGDHNGWIKVTVAGGSGQYRFSKDGGNTFTPYQVGNEYTFDGLIAGTYNIVVEDENGCDAVCL